MAAASSAIAAAAAAAPFSEMLPSHTRSWAAEKRTQFAPLCQMLETTNAAPKECTTLIKVGTRLLLDSGRSRIFASINSSNRSVKLAKQSAQLANCLQRQIGETFEIIDAKGQMRVQPQEEATAEQQEQQQEQDEQQLDADTTAATQPTGSAAATPTAAPAPAPVVAPKDRSRLHTADFMPTGDNSQLIDNNASQALSHSQINLMKSSLAPQQVISQLQANSATFHTKTEYSQEKYLSKKKRKYQCHIATLPCTPLNVIESLQDKSLRSAPIRIDTVSMMLTHCNVSPESRVLIVESGTSGVLLACTAYRKLGQGVIVNLQDKSATCEGQSLNHHSQPDALQKMDMPEHSHQNILHAPFSIVGEAQNDALTDDAISSHAFGDVLSVLRDGVDCLLIASKYDALDVLQRCMPVMRPSSSFAIYNGSCEPLMPVHAALRQSGRCVQVSLAESHMREWQVLPNRTHPHVNMSANSGFILSGFITEAHPAPLQAKALPNGNSKPTAAVAAPSPAAASVAAPAPAPAPVKISPAIVFSTDAMQT